MAENLGNGDLGAEKLAEFREALKIYVEDVSHVIDDVEMKVGEISDKVAEVFTETAGSFFRFFEDNSFSRKNSNGIFRADL